MRSVTIKANYLASLLLVAILVTSIFTAIFVGAQGETTITEESFVETASYVFWRDGSTYYVKNGETGVVTSGLNVTTLVQSSISSLSTGGVIFFKEATYNFTATVAVDNSLLIVGTGNGTILSMSVNTQIFYANGETDILIRDMIFVGSDNPAHNQNVGISMHNCSNIILENLYITKFGVHGIALYNCNDTIISKCVLSGNQYANLYVGETGDIGCNGITVSGFRR